MATDSLGIAYTGAGSGLLSLTLSKTADAYSGYAGVIADGATDQQVAVACRQAGLQMALLYSDQDVTLKTNSSSVPQETIALTATTPVLFVKDELGSNPFAGNVTTMYITNASGSDANVVVRLLYDGTP